MLHAAQGKIGVARVSGQAAWSRGKRRGVTVVASGYCSRWGPFCCPLFPTHPDLDPSLGTQGRQQRAKPPHGARVGEAMLRRHCMRLRVRRSTEQMTRGRLLLGEIRGQRHAGLVVARVL